MDITFTDAPSPGEATHYFHMRTNSVLTREAAIAAGFGSDCMLPLVQVSDPAVTAIAALKDLVASCERPERGVYLRAIDELNDRIAHQAILAADRRVS